MAIIWRVKDGPRGNTTDQGTKISLDDVTKKLENYTCQYLSEQPPEFNTEKASEYYQRVVVEVTSDDTLNDKFTKVGFYVVANLDSSQSAFLTE